MLTVMILLVLGAFITTLVSAAGKCALWVPVLILCVVAAIQFLPLK